MDASPNSSYDMMKYQAHKAVLELESIDGFHHLRMGVNSMDGKNLCSIVLKISSVVFTTNSAYYP